MRKFIITFCLLLGVLSLKAQSVNGIRIDGDGSSIVVYMDGRQISLPTTTCFIANLRGGSYRIEVYTARNYRSGERMGREYLLFDERVFFNGSGVKDIFVGRNEGNRPGNRPYPGNRPSSNEVMGRQAFDRFFESLKRASFDSDKMELIKTALATADFTSAQCRKVVDLYSFDSEKLNIMKLMFPRIDDKENFVIVVDALSFSSNKNEMNAFIRKYMNQR